MFFQANQRCFVAFDKASLPLKSGLKWFWSDKVNPQVMNLDKPNSLYRVTASPPDQAVILTKSESLWLKLLVLVSWTMSERLPRRETYNYASLIALTYPQWAGRQSQFYFRGWQARGRADQRRSSEKPNWIGSRAYHWRYTPKPEMKLGRLVVCHMTWKGVCILLLPLIGQYLGCICMGFIDWLTFDVI